nr:hypothetical protein [Bacteroidota bacterium]
MGTTDNQPLNIVTNDTVRIIVKPNGAVGINTDNTQGFLLSVDGNIRSREVVVNSDVWADFVFDSAYVLISIDSLEKLIQENRKLPDMPSEQDVQENGVALSEMNMLLLMKVEELTLYIIQLNKRLQE